MPSKVTGLQNLGNTCFLNSCVQILLNTPELDSVYKSFEIRVPKVQHTHEAHLFNEWIKLSNEMKITDKSCVNPLAFVFQIHQLAKLKDRQLFTGWAQNDMPEFLLFLIESLHECISRPVKMNINGKSQTKVDTLALKCYEMLGEIYKKEYSELMELFYGMYVSEIFSDSIEQLQNPDRPPIEHPRLSVKPEHYFMLDLPIPRRPKTHKIELMECFDEFVEMDTLYTHENNGWYNETTKTHQDAYKRIQFWNFPKVLVVTLKRFSYDGKKVERMVNYPVRDLDLSKYVCGYNPQLYKYDLYGVCNHFGTTMGGHYTSFVKDARGQWYHCNDSLITHIVNENDVVTQYAYCLFYRKKNQ
jgi:ubiquitin C-terminal hydrolase